LDKSNEYYVLYP